MLEWERVQRFWEWFDSARGQLSIREIEKRAYVPRGRIGNPYSDRRKPSPDVCAAIARGLGLPLETVLKEAGYLEEVDNEADVEIRQIVGYLRALSPAERTMVRRFAEFCYRSALEAMSKTPEE